MVDYTLPLDELPDPLPIESLTKPFDVTITPPGSKSITCRAYVLAALANGESKIIRPLRADDTDHLLNALCTLGAEARWVKSDQHDGEDVYIKGVGGRFPRGGNLYMGEGGTPTRFMIACACLANEPVVIDASPRMRERPISEGVDMLRQLGAKIEYVQAEGRLPVRVVPSELSGGKLNIQKVSSSQFISAVLLIAPCLSSNLTLLTELEPTSLQYIFLTLQSFMDWNVDFRQHADEASREIWVRAEKVIAQKVFIEPDASSAAYWIGAAAVTGSAALIHRLRFDTQQADKYIAINFQPEVQRWTDPKAWASDIRWPVGPATISAGTYDAHRYPDGSMILAILLAHAPRPSTITGLRTLRVKETDRIAAIANELRKVGCIVETGEDWIEITPPAALVARRSASCEPVSGDSTDRKDNNSSHDAERRATSRPIIIETYNDHRMAMAFAVLGLNPPNGVPLAIRNPKCVAKSYPGFWKDFAKLYQ